MNFNLHWKKVGQWCDHRLVPLISLVVMLIPVLAVGPRLQFYALSLVQSETPSIYKAAYRNSFFQPPSLAEWLGLGLDPQFIIMAVLIALAVSFAQTPRSALLYSTIGSAIVLSVTDFTLLFLGPIESTMLENLIANLVGGFLIGGITVTTLCTTRVVAQFLSLAGSSARIFQVLLSAAVGICVSAIALLLIMVFYQPLRVELEFDVKAPAEATVLVDTTSKERDVSELPLAFSLAPTTPHKGKIKITSIATPQELWWRGLHQKLKFDMRLSFFADCYSEAEISKIKTMPAMPYLEKDVSAIFLRLNGGHNNFEVLNDSVNSVDVEPISSIREEPVVRIFSMKHEGKDTSLQFMQTVDKGDAIKVQSKNYSKFAFTAFTFDTNGTETRDTERKLELKVGDRKHTVTFYPSDSARRKRELPCRALNTPEVLRAEKVDLESGTEMIVALFSINPREGANFGFDGNVGQVLLKETNGFLWIYDVKTDDIGGTALGKVHLLDFTQGVESLLVDGEPAKISENSRVFAVGEFDLQITNSGKVRAVGYSRVSWKDSTLLNSTRWEHWGWEVRGAFLAAILAVLTFVGRLLHPWLLADEQW